jgi:hypothetical protein
MDEWVVNYLGEVPTLFCLAFSFERRDKNKEKKIVYCPVFIINSLNRAFISCWT